MVTQQLNTLSTVFFSKWIETGDKMMDTTLIGIMGLIISGLIAYITISWRQYYNLCLFYLYRMYNNPIDIGKIPYSICYNEFNMKEEFINTNPNIRGIINQLDIQLAKHNISLKAYGDSHKWMEKYFKLHAEKQRISYIIKKSNSDMIYEHSSYGIYPIAISNRGRPVYFETYWCVIRGSSIQECDYVLENFCNMLTDIIIKNIPNVTTDEIYVPKNELKLVGAINQNIMTLTSIGNVSKKKTFDTLFYPQKVELITLLERFQNGTIYPSHIPMDNKLGILLYGPPGTGKTGTISAIANMLKRNIAIINFTDITTYKQLDDILKSSEYHKYVYVFDEFDCILDVISGKPIDKKEEKSDWGNMLMFAEGDERKSILQMMKEGRGHKADAIIDMAYLLSKLDGLESAEGRIIVATTNNPDKINPALLRPGRFDFKLCLGLCTPAMIADILTNFYKGDKKMRQRIMNAHIQGKVYSPLQLINLAIQAPNLDKLLKKLSKKV